MGAQRTVGVQAGEGHHVRNVEFLARSVVTERFNLSVVTISPQRSAHDPHVLPGGRLDHALVRRGDVAARELDSRIRDDRQLLVRDTQVGMS